MSYRLRATPRSKDPFPSFRRSELTVDESADANFLKFDLWKCTYVSPDSFRVIWTALVLNTSLQVFYDIMNDVMWKVLIAW